MFNFLLFVVGFTLLELVFGDDSYCGYSADTMNDILLNLSQQGYHIETGEYMFLQNSTLFGANPSSVYGVYSFPFVNYEFPIFWLSGNGAIIFHGCSPPLSKYYSFRSYLDSGTEGLVFPVIFASLGDSTNHLVINYTNNNSPFDALITMITTGDKQTFNDIKNAFNTVDSSLINTLNLDIIPNPLVKFGYEVTRGSNSFTMLVRIAIPDNINDYKNYINTPRPIYYISKGIKYSDTTPRIPFDIPKLRNKTGNFNEFNVLNNSIYQLITNVKSYFINTLNMKFNVETTLKPIWSLDGYYCINNSLDCLGDNRDCAYFRQNGYFTMSDLDYFTVIGVNHYSLNLSVYNNVAIYKNEQPFVDLNNFNGFNNSAIMFNFNNNIKYIQNLFVMLIAREGLCIDQLVQNGVPCLQINYNDLGIHDPMFFVDRSYLNPNTKTGPDYNQTIPETVLYWTLD